MENHFRGKLFDPSKSLDNSKTSSCTCYPHSITFVRDWQRGSRLVFSQTGFGARSVVRRHSSQLLLPSDVFIQRTSKFEVCSVQTASLDRATGRENGGGKGRRGGGGKGGKREGEENKAQGGEERFQFQDSDRRTMKMTSQRSNMCL
jgi:hypothetical protein